MQIKTINNCFWIFLTLFKKKKKQIMFVARNAGQVFLDGNLAASIKMSYTFHQPNISLLGMAIKDAATLHTKSIQEYLL